MQFIKEHVLKGSSSFIGPDQYGFLFPSWEDEEGDIEEGEWMNNQRALVSYQELQQFVSFIVAFCNI
jgi:hypothetical protein